MTSLRSSVWNIALILCFSALLACVADRGQGGGTFRVDTLPNGSMFVANEGAGSWTREFAWKAEEDLRIGTVHGEGPDLFGDISALAVDQEGRIYVGETHTIEVRVFSSDGTFLRSLGGRGEGPGEFRFPSGLTIDPSGRLWVRDGNLHRFSVFSSDGEFLESHPMVYRGYSQPWEPGFDEEGRMLGWETPHPRDLRGDESIEYYPFTPIRLRPDFLAADSFPALVAHYSLMSDPPLPRPFSGSLIFHVDQSQTVWFAQTEEYRVSRRTLTGDTTLVFTLPFEPEAVTPEEAKREAETWLPGRRISIDEVGREKPVLLSLTTSPDGYVFVLPHLNGTQGGTVVDVFRFSGEYCGRVSLPSKVEWRPRFVARPGYLYGVVRDEMDVPFVVRFRLEENTG